MNCISFFDDLALQTNSLAAILPKRYRAVRQHSDAANRTLRSALPIKFKDAHVRFVFEFGREKLLHVL
jgi:hypothetical protein